MAFMDESVWRGKIYSGGWVGGDLGTGLDAPVIEPATASGTSVKFGGAASLEAFTDTRWLTSSPA
jgi:hypothetical protein